MHNIFTQNIVRRERAVSFVIKTGRDLHLTLSPGWTLSGLGSLSRWWGWGGGVSQVSACHPRNWELSSSEIKHWIQIQFCAQWAWGEKYLDCDKITQTLGSNNADNTSGKWIWSVKLFLCFPRIQDFGSGFKKIQGLFNKVKFVSPEFGPLTANRILSKWVKHEFSKYFD